MPPPLVIALSVFPYYTQNMDYDILPPTAVDILYELSADEKVRAEYEMRLKAWRDRSTQFEGYYQDGMEKGMEEGMEKVA